MESWGEAEWTARDVRMWYTPVPLWRIVACVLLIEALLFVLGVELRLWWAV